MFYPKAPLKKIGPLDVVEVNAGQQGPCLVVFHGFGADANDLAPLAQELSVPKKTRWLFPNGPLEVPIGPGFTGRAWFPINAEALQRAAMTGETLDFSKVYPPGLSEARDLALQMIMEAGLSPDQLILGGFSQGSMLALEVALTLPQPPKALVILSGNLLDQDHTAHRAKERLQGVPFFQSHGERDEILPFQNAIGLEKVLTDAGLKGGLQSFSGGHEIPLSVMKALSHFLQQQIRA